MKTIFDISTRKFLDNTDESKKEFKSDEELVDIINDILITYPNQTYINVKKMTPEIRAHLENMGFSVYTNSIHFKGYSKWVYFKNGLPVFFDSLGSGILTPSHECEWCSKVYETLDYDDYKKIKF